MKIKLFKSKDLKYLQLDVNEFIKDKLVISVNTCIGDDNTYLITIVYDDLVKKDE